MALNYEKATEAIENIRYTRRYASVAATPNGKLHFVLGPAMNSETLVAAVVLLDPRTTALIAVAPKAVSMASADLNLQIDPASLLQFKPVRHKKGGLYTKLANVRSRDGEEVLYVSHEDRMWWLRPLAMFEDGRFEASDHAPLTLADLIS